MGYPRKNFPCNNNDAAAVAALWTDDAVFVTDKGPVYGKEGVQKQYKGALTSNYLSTRDPKTTQILMMGDKPVIAVNGEWSQTIQPKDGAPIQLKGYWSALDVLEGGLCKVHWVTYNVTQPPHNVEPVAATK